MRAGLGIRMLNRIRAFLDGLCVLPVLAVLTAGIGMLALPDTKYGQFLIQFLSPAWVISALLLTVALAGRFRVSLVMATLSTVILSVCLYPQWIPGQDRHGHEQQGSTARPAAPVFRVVFANNWFWNKTPERIGDWIAAEQPDLVVLAETNNLDLNTIRRIGRGAYPIIENYKEFWILSRHPIRTAYTRTPGDGHPGGMALWDFDLLAGEHTYRIVAIHTTRPWPFTKEYAQTDQKDYATRIINRRNNRHTVLIGDFNAVPRTPVMQAYARETGLRLTPVTLGTWPTALPGALRLGIDNALYSQGFILVDRKVGPHTGSDHRPIRLDLYPAT